MAINFTSKAEVKTLLGKNQAFPSKRLGQHFLIDKFAIKKAVGAANLSRKDTVLEVGPGLGALTKELVKASGQVVAVEKDPKIAAILKETFTEAKNLEIVHGDILKNPHTKYKIQDTRYKIVANLPFYLTAPVIRQFLESENPPKQMILVVQKEVGQRICSRPPKTNLLAISVQFYAEPEIISYISKKSFWPEPKVDSAIVKITPLKKFPKSDFGKIFFKVVKAGFSQPRKTLTNNLAKKLGIPKDKTAEILKKNHISPSQRPETLKISDWENLAKEFSTLYLL